MGPDAFSNALAGTGESTMFRLEEEPVSLLAISPNSTVSWYLVLSRPNSF